MNKRSALLRAVLIVVLFFSMQLSFAQQADHGEKETDKDTTHKDIEQKDASHEGASHNDVNHKEEKFNFKNLIFHHIGDSYEWHFASIGDKHYTLPLPVILYSDRGVHFFPSSKFHEEGKAVPHGDHGHAVALNHGGKNFHLAHEKISLAEGESGSLIDLSITKNVVSILLSAVLLFVVFTMVARSYKKQGIKSAPKGMQSFFEPIITFVRDDIAKENIGSKYEQFVPYLLTVFFFIWFNNLLGLMPGGANVTGNIAVTFVLAIFTWLITTFRGNKHYWKHIFATPGVPVWLLPLMIPVEIIGIFTKPFSLMIRLFANITAGHILILSLISLIFMFKSVAVAGASVPFALVMNCLELFVAILQAYVFTLLTAMYFGSAVDDHH